ncbi:MAG: hypothetical protein SGJ11_07140 [Phycisphaerae bacterium]|nr:hypothetical protein [Phycisphaerae bacterium]
MSSSSRRTTSLILAIIACALLFALAVPATASMRGIAGPTIAMAASPTNAALWIALAFAGSIAVACAIGRYINAVVGMFTLGCGVSVLAMRSGTIEDFAFARGSILMLAVEVALWALLVLAATLLVFRVSGPLPDAVETDEPRVHGPFGSRVLLAQPCGVLVLVGVLIIAVSAAKGQALAAVFVGSVVAALAARLVAPKSPPILFFVTPLLVGCAGYLIAFLMLKNTRIDVAYVQLTLSRLAYPMPIDYAAGALAGVAVGIGWARSFLKHEPART